MLKVPQLELIHSVLNPFFSKDTPVNGWAEEDEDENLYIKNPNGSLFAHLPKDTWYELLKEEEIENEN